LLNDAGQFLNGGDDGVWSFAPGNGSNRSLICSGVTGWPTVVEAKAKFDHYFLDAKAAFTCVEKTMTMLDNQNIAAFVLTSDFGSR